MFQEMADIDVTFLTAHRTIATSTFRALKTVVPLATILGVAGWFQSSTFAKFFKKNVTSHFLPVFCGRIVTNPTNPNIVTAIIYLF